MYTLLINRSFSKLFAFTIIKEKKNPEQSIIISYILVKELTYDTKWYIILFVWSFLTL